MIDAGGVCVDLRKLHLDYYNHLYEAIVLLYKIIICKYLCTHLYIFIK